MFEDEINKLICAAVNARNFAYAPYSGYKVGAALYTVDKKIYDGCNIENAAYTPTNCAERTAFFKAVSEGNKKFSAIAVATKNGSGFPCGVCRQVMREFCDPASFIIYISDIEHNYKKYFLSELLPLSFGPENIREPL